MPGADWIGPARVGRVGSGRLGRGLEPACAGKGPSRAAAPARARASALPAPVGARGPCRGLPCCPSLRPAWGPEGDASQGASLCRLSQVQSRPGATLGQRPSWRGPARGERAGPRRGGRCPSGSLPSAATAHLPSRPVSSRLPRCDLRGRPALAGQGEEKWFQYANLGGRGSRRASPVTSPLFPGASGPPLPRPCLPSLQL